MLELILAGVCFVASMVTIYMGETEWGRHFMIMLMLCLILAKQDR